MGLPVVVSGIMRLVGKPAPRLIYLGTATYDLPGEERWTAVVLGFSTRIVCCLAAALAVELAAVLALVLAAVLAAMRAAVLALVLTGHRSTSRTSDQTVQ